MALDFTDGTPPLQDFRREYEQDDNIWWAIECGHHQNLFEYACDEIDRLQAIIDGKGS